MTTDYRKQYQPHQLEPFWPNEILKMVVSVLVTLAVIMFLVVLPVFLEMVGLGGMIHAEEPANPRGGTPVGIKPEWYFLWAYQYLRVWPTELLGISGKTWGVLSQGPLILVVVLLPLLYRRAAHRRPNWFYRLAITGAIVTMLIFTFWGGWPEHHDEDGNPVLVSFAEYFHHAPLFFIFTGATIVIFYALIVHERRCIRRILGPDPQAKPAPRPTQRTTAPTGP